MPFDRLKNNPLLSPKDLSPTRSDMEILCTFNPGAVRVGDEILLLVRVAEKPVNLDGELATVIFDPQAGDLRTLRIKKTDPELKHDDPRVFTWKGRGYLTSISHLRIARSRDGGKTFKFDPKPAIVADRPDEMYGCEDPRVTYIEGKYWINYSCISDRGVATALAVTEDWKTFEKKGLIFTTCNKDIAIFPQRVRGMYVCRHRPDGSMFNRPSIWTAYSPDMVCWGKHSLTLEGTAGAWDGSRIGCGAPPIKTRVGWLDIYHGADAKGRYCLGAMLTDLEYPEKLISRSSKPVFEPTAPYEITGLYGNCTFSNGLIADADGTLTLYYGAADTVCAAAVSTVDEMIALAKS